MGECTLHGPGGAKVLLDDLPPNAVFIGFRTGTPNTMTEPNVDDTLPNSTTGGQDFGPGKRRIFAVFGLPEDEDDMVWICGRWHQREDVERWST